MKKILNKSLVGLITMVLLIASLSSCEDDPIVTPTTDEDDCTGSYCKLDMNQKSENTIAYQSQQNTNPKLF